MECLICKKEIKDWKKCQITIKTMGKWIKKKKGYYHTILRPVCYGCVENMRFGNETKKTIS